MSALKDLLAFDRQLLAGKSISGSGKQLSLFAGRATHIIGVDEVGRGCLAGPVVAAAVILPGLTQADNGGLNLLNDSKKISEATREALATALHKSCRYAVAEASVAEIDEINILHASLLAMKRAIRALLVSGPAQGQGEEKYLVAVDGNKRIKDLGLEQITVVKGDSRSASIAAASVLAKVYRDELMTRLAREFPVYGWEANKGYPSALHREGIKHAGVSPWHRLSFRLLKEEGEEI
jgi:ribonuclease HII